MTTASLLVDESYDPARVKARWGIEMRVRDGTCLRGILYDPAGRTGPCPVILTVTPYVSQRYHDVGQFFAAAGYVFLAMDARGRGNSEGSFRPPHGEAEDCHDILEWLALQPFCNGDVAMWGGSYSGYLQWAAAKTRPPHLRTIVPMASPFRGFDSPAPDNIFMPYRIQWLALIAGRTSQESIFADQKFWDQQYLRFFKSGRPFNEIDDFLGFPSAIFKEWMRHPYRDAYWENYNLSDDDYNGITIPTLTVTGCYDANQRGALEHYRLHLGGGHPSEARPHYLVIGPWNHAGIRRPKEEFGGIKTGQQSLLNLLELNRQWYDWQLRGSDRPEFLRDYVAYYVLGADEWHYADRLDRVTETYLELGLQGNSHISPQGGRISGILARGGASEAASSSYVHDPRDTSLGELETTVGPENWTDQTMVLAADRQSLIFQGEAFEDETLLVGFFKLTAWVSIDQPDTDFRCAIYLVFPDGSSVMLASQSLRARYRQSLSSPSLIPSDDALQYDFDRFNFVSRLAPQGSYLRLVFGPLNSIYSEKNYNAGGEVAAESVADARIVTVRLWHDAARRSTLHVPLGQRRPS